MASCRAIHHRWTLRALVAAFLDLALSYLFLCAASLVFFASKILSFFGLALPCSCDLVLVDRRPRPEWEHQHQHRGLGCIQGLLLDYPAGKIAGFLDSVCGNDARAPRDGKCYTVQFLNDGDGDGGGGVAAARGKVEDAEGEESCGSVPQPLPPQNSRNLSLLLVDGGESCSYRKKEPVDVKGKTVFRLGNPPQAVKRRQRQKSSLTVKGKSFPAPPSPSMAVPRKGEVATDNFALAESPTLAISGIGNHLSGDQNDLLEEVTSANECQTQDKVFSNGNARLCDKKSNEFDVIRELKQALEEERSARAALYLELEEERNAAAIAADEAMAMILRLQEEKATLKMEARQFQRMVEEKSTYDEEEMVILKEIIVRREREKHVLEKEIEAYQQLMFGADSIKQASGSDLPEAAELIGEDNNCSFGLSDDPDLMLKEVYEFIKEKEKFGDEKQHVDVIETLMAPGQNSSAKESLTPLEAEELKCSSVADPSQSNSVRKHYQGTADEASKYNVKEKGMFKLETDLSSAQSNSINGSISSSCRVIGSQTNGSHDLNKGDRTQDWNPEVPVDNFSKRQTNGDKAASKPSTFDTEACVLDVHVIGHEVDLSGADNTSQTNLSQVGCDLGRSQRFGMSKIPFPAGRVAYSTEDIDIRAKPLYSNMHRSSSEVLKVDQIMDISNNRSSLLSSRRSSVPGTESERLKLETEVELLRKRLKVIQQEREKLSFSAELREKETYNLHRLEEIAYQLQEIRNSTEHGKSINSVSLPPSSKVRHQGKFV